MGTGNGDAVSFGNRRQATGTHFVSGSVASNLAGWVGLLVSVPFSEKKTDTNNTICQRSIPDPYSSGPGGLRGLLPWGSRKFPLSDESRGTTTSTPKAVQSIHILIRIAQDMIQQDLASHECQAR